MGPAAVGFARYVCPLHPELWQCGPTPGWLHVLTGALLMLIAVLLVQLARDAWRRRRRWRGVEPPFSAEAAIHFALEHIETADERSGFLEEWQLGNWRLLFEEYPEAFGAGEDQERWRRTFRKWGYENV